jgi:hypothetical protein
MEDIEILMDDLSFLVGLAVYLGLVLGAGIGGVLGGAIASAVSFRKQQNAAQGGATPDSNSVLNLC